MVPEKVERGFMRPPFSNRILPQPAVGKVSLNRLSRLSVRFSVPLEHIARRGFTEANATNMSFFSFKKGLTSSAISETYETLEI